MYLCIYTYTPHTHIHIYTCIHILMYTNADDTHIYRFKLHMD